MGTMSVWHWLILGGVLMVAFGGKGKISSIMGDVADGIKSFKKGMADDATDAKKAEEQKALEAKKAVQNVSNATNDMKV
jgi:sec-independent protein translocase protein TatA